MTLRDQDGNEVESVEVVFPSGVAIGRAVVHHSRVELFVLEALGGELAFVIDRPTHPGAGLALDVSDWIEQG